MPTEKHWPRNIFEPLQPGRAKPPSASKDCRSNKILGKPAFIFLIALLNISKTEKAFHLKTAQWDRCLMTAWQLQYDFCIIVNKKLIKKNNQKIQTYEAANSGCLQAKKDLRLLIIEMYILFLFKTVWKF